MKLAKVADAVKLEPARLLDGVPDPEGVAQELAERAGAEPDDQRRQQAG